MGTQHPPAFQATSPIAGGGLGLRADATPTALRRQLRQQMTPSERLLWKYLQGKSFEGLKFRRQHGVGPYIVDFYCAKLRLVIEVDGGIHIKKEIAAYDAERSLQLQAIGCLIFRCSNEEVMFSVRDLLNRLRVFVRSISPPAMGE